jgi:hypothetical protein
MKRKPKRQVLPAELFQSSYEVIARQFWLMASRRCSHAEYRRMVTEKVLAANDSMNAIWTWKSPADIMRPWHRRVNRNVKRLRRRRDST